MRVIEGDLNKMPRLEFPVVLSMGSFDGVHLGHQHLIKELVEKAKTLGVVSVAVSFSPHPEAVLRAESFQYLMTKEQKIAKLAALGLDYLVLQDFSSDFSKVRAEDFLRQYLLGFFKPRAILFGYDFRFGFEGQGDFNNARSWLQEEDVEVTRSSPLQIKGSAVSSTAIREALTAGQVEWASQLLGEMYSLTGVVERGDAIGRTLGFPTANLGEVKTLIPGFGVYSAWVYVGQNRRKGVVNIGNRPTVNGKERRVECHILDFSEDIYGQNLRVELCEKIRGEQKFANLATLKEQIKLDIVEARKRLEDTNG